MCVCVGGGGGLVIVNFCYHVCIIYKVVIKNILS